MIQPTLEINSSYVNSNGDTVDNWMRADLMNGVKIVVKDKIKDSKDVGKVFTAYTNQFKLPASKNNNRIFKRFANHNVFEVFDARRKHSAIIKLNGVDFKKGYIKLNKVNLVDMLPESYDIQFFGELTSLKDILGEYKLKDLVSLGNKYTHPYSDFNALEGFIYGYDVAQLPPSSGGGVQITRNEIDPMFKYPLISNARGFEYSGTADTQGFHRILSDEEKEANYVIQHKDRINRFDLKPAMKLSMIFDAIQDSSDIFKGRVKFNTDWLFGGGGIEPSTLDEIYVWLHNNKGFMTYTNSTNGKKENVFTRSLVSGNVREEGEWTLNNTPSSSYCTDVGGICPDIRSQWGNGYSSGGTLQAHYSIGEGSVTLTATVYVDDLAPVVYTKTGELSSTNVLMNLQWALGSSTIDGGDENRPTAPVANSIRVVFQMTSGADIGEIKPRLKSTLQYGFYTWGNTFLDGNENVNPYPNPYTLLPSVAMVDTIIPNRLLPDVKIIDFLSDLFKTFNLVAFEERLDDGTYQINIQSLDFYLGEGRQYDITEYVDISKSTVERISPYSVVEYKFPKPKTFLAINQAEITGDEFGSMTFNVDNFTEGEQSSNSLLFDGGKYKVEPKFEKMMYERLTNSDDETLTNIQWGWSANDNKENVPEPVVGSPLLMYANRKVLAYVNPVTFVPYGGVDWFDGQNVTRLPVGYIPSSVSVDGVNTLNFNAEFDEYTREINSNSLFANFHNIYISGVYSPYARRQSLTAYLPPVIFTKLKLNDSILINRVSYTIDSMDINITDAKTKLNLLRMTDEKKVYVGRGQEELAWNEITEQWDLESTTWDGTIKE